MTASGSSPAAGSESDLAASLAISLLAHLNCDGELSAERGEGSNNLTVRCSGCGGVFEYPLEALTSLIGGPQAGSDSPASTESAAPSGVETGPQAGVPAPSAPTPGPPPAAAPGPAAAAPEVGAPPGGEPAETGLPPGSGDRIVAVPYHEEEDGPPPESSFSDEQEGGHHVLRAALITLVAVGLIVAAILLSGVLDDEDDGAGGQAVPTTLGQSPDGGSSSAGREPDGDRAAKPRARVPVFEGEASVLRPRGWELERSPSGQPVEMFPPNTRIAVSMVLEVGADGSVQQFTERAASLVMGVQPDGQGGPAGVEKDGVRMILPYVGGRMLARTVAEEDSYLLIVARVPELASANRVRQVREILASARLEASG